MQISNIDSGVILRRIMRSTEIFIQRSSINISLILVYARMVRRYLISEQEQVFSLATCISLAENGLEPIYPKIR